MQLSAGDCDILIRVNRRMANYCLAGGLALIVAAAAAIVVALWLHSDALLGFGAAVAGGAGLVPFKTYYDRVSSITLLEQVRDSLSGGGSLSEAMTIYLQKALAVA